MVQGVVDAANPEPRQREGIDAYRQQFNADPDYFVATGWDAMMILGRALKAAGPKRGSAASTTTAGRSATARTCAASSGCRW